MITTPLLTWVNTPSARGPVAQVAVSFTADPSARVRLRGGILGNDVYPVVVTVDNTGNAQNVSVTMNGVVNQVSGNVRATLPIAKGTVFLDATATLGATNFIFYADPRDAAPDQPNYLALISAALAATMLPGFMLDYAGNIAPTGWLICDGSPVSRVTFANLFAVVGVTFGAGDGLTTFNIPDCRDRFSLGVSVGGLGGQRNTARALASTGGEETHVLGINEVPAHNHGVNDPTHSHGGLTGNANADHTHGVGPGWYFFSGLSGGDGAAVALGGGGDAFGGFGATTGISNNHQHSVAAGATGITTANAGGGVAFDKMPNYLAVNRIIKT